MTALSPRGALILEAVRCAQALPVPMRIVAGKFGDAHCGCPMAALSIVCGRRFESREETATRVLRVNVLWYDNFILGFDGSRTSPWKAGALEGHRDGRALRARLLPAMVAQ